MPARTSPLPSKVESAPPADLVDGAPTIERQEVVVAADEPAPTRTTIEVDVVGLFAGIKPPKRLTGQEHYGLAGVELCGIRELVLTNELAAADLVAAATEVGQTHPHYMSMIFGIAWSREVDEEATRWLRDLALEDDLSWGNIRTRAAFTALHTLTFLDRPDDMRRLVVALEQRMETAAPAFFSGRSDRFMPNAVHATAVTHALYGTPPEVVDELTSVLDNLLRPERLHTSMTVAAWTAAARSRGGVWADRLLDEAEARNGHARQAIAALDDERQLVRLRGLFQVDVQDSYERFLTTSAIEGLIGLGTTESLQTVQNALVQQADLERRYIHTALDTLRGPKRSCLRRVGSLAALLQLQRETGIKTGPDRSLDEYIAHLTSIFDSCTAPAFELSRAMVTLRRIAPELPAGSSQRKIALTYLARFGTPEDVAFARSLR